MVRAARRAQDPGEREDSEAARRAAERKLAEDRIAREEAAEQARRQADAHCAHSSVYAGGLSSLSLSFCFILSFLYLIAAE